MIDRPIGIFDSGIGGLTTLYECKKLLPCERFIYLADTFNLPYGTKTDEQIKSRVFACVKLLFERGVKAVVVACNTATNAGIRELRNMYPCIFVGLEPALKPAYEMSKNEGILLLCTQATASGQKLAALIEKLDAKNVIISPQKKLAEHIETTITKGVLSEEKNIIEAIFSSYCNGTLFSLNLLTDELDAILKSQHDYYSVVLGCTHYVFVKSIIQSLLGEKIRVFDGNMGAAKRLEFLLRQNGLLAKGTHSFDVEFLPPPPKQL